MQAKHRITTVLAALTLASAGAYADKGGGGGHEAGDHDGGRAAASTASPKMSPSAGMTTAAPGATTTTLTGKGAGTTTSAVNSANGAAHSGLTTGQGRITANAAHQRNIARPEAKPEVKPEAREVENRNGVLRNEVEERNRGQNRAPNRV